MIRSKAMAFVSGKGMSQCRPDGLTYEGHWKDDKREGRGKQVTKSGVVQEGTWRNDKYVGADG